MMFPVIGQMAGLTHGPEVIVLTMFRDMVQVGHGQDHPGFRAIGGFSVEILATSRMGPPATFPEAFTTPFSPLETDSVADGRPVLWITGFILGPNGHGLLDSGVSP